MRKKGIAALLLSTVLLSACQSSVTESTAVQTSEQATEVVNTERASEDDGLMVIEEQGYFTAGGTVRTNEGTFVQGNAYASTEGQTVHGDHASVFYQIPENARDNAMVFLHGITQSGKCWSTTADGREGFSNIFLKDDYSIYLVDQPRRGQAGQSTEDATVPSDAADQMYFEQFRIGQWPDFYEGVQFPKDEDSIDEFFRQMTPNIGGYPSMDVLTDSMVQTFEKSGDGIFFTHSAGGVVGWLTAMATDKVTGIVALEPGMFVFPEGEVPEPIHNLYEEVSGIETYPMVVSREEFDRLTQIPIIIYYGDYIPDEPCDNPGQDYWRSSRDYALLFAETVNAHGGDATVVELPDIGIKGNTHFIMSDLNNEEVAAHITKWLDEKGLR